MIWIMSIFTCSFCIFILYPDFKHFPGFYYDRFFHIVYQSTSRIIWAISVGLIIYACGISKGSKFYR